MHSSSRLSIHILLYCCISNKSEDMGVWKESYMRWLRVWFQNNIWIESSVLELYIWQHAEKNVVPEWPLFNLFFILAPLQVIFTYELFNVQMMVHIQNFDSDLFHRFMPSSCSSCSSTFGKPKQHLIAQSIS